MTKNHYYFRLLRVILGFISAMACGVLLTWSYYREPLLDLFPDWTMSDLSLLFSVQNIVVALAMVFGGLFLKKVPSRVIFLIAAACLFVGLGGFYFLPVGHPRAAFGLAFLFYSIIAAIGCGISCLLCCAIYPAWYPDRPGFVSGLMITAFNSCAFVTGAIASVLIPRFGIRSALFATGIIAAAATLLSVPFGEFPGPQHQLPPAAVRTENRSARDYTTKEMLRTPVFWTVFLYHTLIFGAGLILADHAAGIAKYFGAAALFGMLFAPAKGAACFLTGWIMDKLSATGVMLIIDTIVTGSACLLIFASRRASTILILVGLILLGYGIGGVSTFKATAIRFFFGNKNYQQNFGITNVNIVFSSLIVYFAGRAIEAMGGTYSGIFTLFLIIGGLGFVCTVLLGLFTAGRKLR